MEIYLQKRMGALVPADERAEDALRKIALNTTIKARISAPRNVFFHRKFFAMLNIVLKNQSLYPSLDLLLSVCKLATGHAEVIQTKHGNVAIPKSISFAKMDELAFNEFYDRAVQWVLVDVIPGLQRNELDSEVETELKAFAA